MWYSLRDLQDELRVGAHAKLVDATSLVRAETGIGEVDAAQCRERQTQHDPMGGHFRAAVSEAQCVGVVAAPPQRLQWCCGGHRDAPKLSGKGCDTWSLPPRTWYLSSAPGGRSTLYRGVLQRRGHDRAVRTAVRRGRERGSVSLGGGRVPITRQRLRVVDGAGEVAVPTLRAAYRHRRVGPYGDPLAGQPSGQR